MGGLTLGVVAEDPGESTWGLVHTFDYIICI